MIALISGSPPTKFVRFEKVMLLAVPSASVIAVAGVKPESMTTPPLPIAGASLVDVGRPDHAACRKAAQAVDVIDRGGRDRSRAVAGQVERHRGGAPGIRVRIRDHRDLVRRGERGGKHDGVSAVSLTASMGCCRTPHPPVPPRRRSRIAS